MNSTNSHLKALARGEAKKLPFKQLQLLKDHLMKMHRGCGCCKRRLSFGKTIVSTLKTGCNSSNIYDSFCSAMSALLKCFTYYRVAMYGQHPGSVPLVAPSFRPCCYILDDGFPGKRYCRHCPPRTEGRSKQLQRGERPLL